MEKEEKGRGPAHQLVIEENPLAGSQLDFPFSPSGRDSRAESRLNILKVSTNIGQCLCLWGLCGSSRSSGQGTV